MKSFSLPSHLIKYRCSIDLLNAGIQCPQLFWQALYHLQDELSAVELAAQMSITTEDSLYILKQLLNHKLVTNQSSQLVTYKTFLEKNKPNTRPIMNKGIEVVKSHSDGNEVSSPKSDISIHPQTYDELTQDSDDITINASTPLSTDSKDEVIEIN